MTRTNNLLDNNNNNNNHNDNNTNADTNNNNNEVHLLCHNILYYWIQFKKLFSEILVIGIKLKKYNKELRP